MFVLRRYKWVGLLLLLDILVYAVDQNLGEAVAWKTMDSIGQMLSFIPPIFLILGLLDTWVPKEKVVNHLGAESGWKGAILAVLLGMANAGPLYAAFPAAAVMLKKGASLFNVLVFIGAWATLKIPMFLFETQFLGGLFSVTRWICSFIGILLISYFIDLLHSQTEKQMLYSKHQEG